MLLLQPLRNKGCKRAMHHAHVSTSTTLKHPLLNIFKATKADVSGVQKQDLLALTRMVEVVVRDVLQLLVCQTLVEGVLPTPEAQLHRERPSALVLGPAQV